MGDDVGGFSAKNETQVRRLLVEAGYGRVSQSRGGLSPVEIALAEVERTRVVDYAGPLAGRKAGHYFMNGARVLVTGSPRIIPADTKVEWPLLNSILEGVLGHEPAQLAHLLGWLKTAYLGLKSGIETEHGPDAPGQALVIAGPAGCGKTLLQDIIRVTLGGRQADPFPFISGQSHFNRDLLGAECLMFGDQVSSTHMAARRKIGAALKQLVANPEHRCEAKGKDALSLRPFWRVTASTNDEPENLCVLPPFDESIRDKIILLKAVRHSIFDTELWTQGRRVVWEKLMAEMPGFLAHVEGFEIPPALRCSRYGVREFHHPDLLEALGALSSEHRLLELIDTEIFSKLAAGLPPRKPWHGKAAELERRLLDNSDVSRQATRLLSWDAAAGTYLARLCKSASGRVTQRKLHGNSVYTITPPEPEPASPAT